MRVLALGRRALEGRYLRVIASALSVLVLAAVPALGITRLGGDALSSWGARDGSPGGGPLTFDAPAATVARHKAPEAKHVPAGAKVDPASVVELTDWTFTDTRSDVLALIALEQGQVSTDQFLAGLAIPAINTGQISGGTVTQIFIRVLGGQLLTDQATINRFDPAQAPLAALLDQEVATDVFLFQHPETFPLEFLNQVIFQQLLINSFVQGQFLGGLPAAVIPTIPPIVIPASPSR